MFIQCFIEKADGSDVFVDFEGVRYVFTKNAVGDAVCFVGNQAHVRRLLKMGAGAYDEYLPPDELGASDQPGASPQPLGGRQTRPDPGPNDPLPDGRTVDEGLSEGGDGDVDNPQMAGKEADPADAPPVEVSWAPQAVDTKIKEFKFLGKDEFKNFVDANAERIMGWPQEVRCELAKKLNKNFPDHDPGIEGFNIDDYLGSGNPGST